MEPTTVSRTEATRSSLVSDPAELTRILNEYRKLGAHVLYPLRTVDQIAPLHAVSVREIRTEPDPSSGDVYKAENGLAHTKYALNMMEAAAGVDWLYAEIRRIDDGTIQHYCVYQAAAVVRNLDGTLRRVVESREVDLREGSEQVAKMRPGQLPAARANIQQLAESKAKNRVRRSILLLKANYKPEELKRPFVILKLVPVPEVGLDADVMRSIAIEMARNLYGVPTIVDVARPIAEPLRVSQTAPTPQEIPPDDDDDDGLHFPQLDAQVIPEGVDDGALVRNAQLVRISELYPKKYGKPRPESKPLYVLEQWQLNDLEAFLLAKPDFVPESA